MQSGLVHPEGTSKVHVDVPQMPVVSASVRMSSASNHAPIILSGVLYYQLTEEEKPRTFF